MGFPVLRAEKKGMVKMIEIENVSKRIKKHTVLDDVSLSVESGDFILLKGHNGSGKTMLIRLISGLITPDAGMVKRANGLSFGVIIETPNFFMSETAMYNLKYLASVNKKIGEDRITELLKRFNLYRHRNKKVRTFSMGMKQRLALVQAMMEEPDVLLLDEPFNGIDDDNLAITYRLLNEYHREGHTVIIASHGDYQECCRFNRVITMSGGKITGDVSERSYPS